MIRIVVQHAPIDVAAELALIEPAGAGAVATFTGLVRADEGVTALELEHYPGMTESVLRHLANEAANRWALLGASIVHRVGAMAPGERVVFAAAAAGHRAEALDACAFLIDRLKIDAPFWKREFRGAEARWIGARATDAAASARWLAG